MAIEGIANRGRDRGVSPVNSTRIRDQESCTAVFKDRGALGREDGMRRPAAIEWLHIGRFEGFAYSTLRQ